MKTIFRVLLLIISFSASAGEVGRGVLPNDSCKTIKSREAEHKFKLLGEKTLEGHTVLTFGNPSSPAKSMAFYRCDGNRWDYSYIELQPSISSAFSKFTKIKNELINKYGKPAFVSNHMRSSQPMWLRARALALGESGMLDVYMWQKDEISITLAFYRNDFPTKLLDRGWSIDFTMHRQEKSP